jgi:hypothetical protein
MDLDLHKSLEALEQAGIKVESPGDSIEKIARENQLIPVDVYAVIRVHQLAQAPLDLNNMTAEEVEDRYSGTGIGRKSLQEISAMAGIDKTLATRRLGQAGYLVEEKDNLRAIADRYELSPIDVLKVILVEDYRVVEK